MSHASYDTLAAQASTTSPKRVLLVEDDDAVAGLFDHALRSANYDVVRAANGRDARLLIENGAFDAIVSDIVMPSMGGIELLKAVRERDADVPVVLVTGQPQVETAMEAVEYGALRYLAKPVGANALRKVVAEAIRAGVHARMKADALPLLAEKLERTADFEKRQTQFQGALSNLYMVFQPIVHASEGILGFEALVRSREPSLARPDELLATAEEISAFDALGRAVRRHVADAAAAIGAGALLFVNLHPSELLDHELYTVSNPLSKHAKSVVFEITERVSLEAIDHVPERIQSLRSRGYRFAVDDLGSGYAGLTSVIELTPDFVKVDMELVRDVDTTPSKRKLVESLARACADLGIPVVFEGVESAAEGRALLEVGALLFQGYYVSRPTRSIDEEMSNHVMERMRTITGAASLSELDREAS